MRVRPRCYGVEVSQGTREGDPRTSRTDRPQRHAAIAA